MRSGAAGNHVGYFHETAFYDSDESFLSIVEPFLREGVECGEPTLVTCAAPNAALLRRALGPLDGVTFIAGEARYVTPAATIRSYREHFTKLVAGGAEQIRVVGDVPHPGRGVPWDSWARYEAAINHAYDSFPLWGMCPYDLRTTPDFVLDEVVRTHTHVASPAGHRANDCYTPPTQFLDRRAASADPLEATPPDVALRDPSPKQARAVVQELSSATQLEPHDIEGLVLSVSETITNGILHGREPVDMRVWVRPTRVVVTVHDAGSGPADPLAGLLPPPEGSLGGRGMWLSHLSCADVNLRVDVHGFTVRLVAGDLV
jgi:anti-sigma regulatory factor (Ser/Thr protein kinase)